MPLPTPVGEQASVVAYPPTGHLVLLGTAGSGKTTMAVHRAVLLSNAGQTYGGRTLLVTYNRSLVAYLNHLGSEALQNVDVVNYHKFASGYLSSRDLMDWGSIIKPDLREVLIAEAVDQVRESGEFEDLDRPYDFFDDEISFIQQQGLGELDAYLEADRVGRGTGLRTDTERPFVFSVYETYRELRAEQGYDYDYDDLATAVREAFADDETDRLYRHVVIDEGQDFSPEMIRSLALAIPDDGSLSFFGDVAQRIYGNGVSWRSAGLQIRRKKEFSRNYRNSPAIAKLALAISDMDYFGEDPDMVAPTTFAAAGPPPTVVFLNSDGRESEFVIEQAQRAAVSGSVGILCRRKHIAKRFHQQLSGSQLVDRELAFWNPDIAISCGTFHAMKGLEFDTVLLVGLSAEKWPDPELVRKDGEEAGMEADGKLFYVGCTRARQNLVITSVGALSNLFPENDDLWKEQTL